MMFMQFFMEGAYIPVISLYFRDYLHFTGGQTGMILASSAVAAFISPLIASFVADRLIRAETLFAICHFIGAILMLILSLQRQFIMVLLCYMLFIIVIGPTIALVNSITFHHSPEPGEKFGNIRLWGTVGWIVPAWVLGIIWFQDSDTSRISQHLPDALRLAAAASLILALYSLSLPGSDVKPEKLKTMIPLESIRVMLQPHIMLLAAIAFFVAFVDKYYYFGAAPFLRQLGFSDASIMPSLSIGQVSEIFAMLTLAFFIKRIGIKRVLMIGILMEVWRFTAFSIGTSIPLIFSGLICHGFAYAFFFVAAFIYLDDHCSKQARTGAHQLFAFIFAGLSSLTGNLVAGRAMDVFTVSTTAETTAVNYRSFWMVPMIISALCFVVITLTFPAKNNNLSTEPVQ